MPKVKKKSVGGNPILLAQLAKKAKKAVELGKKAKELYDSIYTLYKEKKDLYDALMEKISTSDIKGIGVLLETELKKIDDDSSKELKPKIEEVKKIYHRIPRKELEQILDIVRGLSGSTNSIQAPGNKEGLFNQDANQGANPIQVPGNLEGFLNQGAKNLEGFLNQGANQDANQANQSQSSKKNTQNPVSSLSQQMIDTARKTNEKANEKLHEKNTVLETQGDRVDKQFNDRKNAGIKNPMQRVLDSEHGTNIPALSDNRFNYGNNSGINLGYSEPPENIDNSPAIYIMIAIAMKGILRYIWNLFVVTVKTSYRVLTDFVLIPFYIFLPYVFDVLAVFIILIMLILVILYFVSGGGSKQTRSPGNPFDSIISGVSSIIFNFFNPDLSGVIELKDNIESDATSFVGGIKKFIMDIIDMIKETIIAPILRKFIPNPDINDIDEKDKEKREKNNGRCDNISEIESKDGRYCYKQLKQKNTTWGNNITIPYKLFEKSDMDNPTVNAHYDYYMPNCKIHNTFTEAVIDLDTEDNRRTKFICKI
ncbi:hypothetical protein OAA30_00490 [bacterium]|nr:hypothetical protein [bacterium]